MGFEFHTQSEKGAILVLPRGGHSLQLQQRQKVEDLARKNGKSWYKFVNGPGPFERGVPNGTLGLVTKVVKTSDFGVASFEDASHSGGVSFTLKAASAVAGQASASFKWQVSSAISHRSGPERVPEMVSSFYSSIIYDLTCPQWRRTLPKPQQQTLLDLPARYASLDLLTWLLII